MAVSIRGDQTICLPVESETQYRQIVLAPQASRLFLSQALNAHPELFPPQILEGLHFHDFVHSLKQDLTLRRIKLAANEDIYHENWLHNLSISMSMNGHRKGNF